MDKIFLEGKNIFLRTIEKTDLTDNYRDWFNDSEVCTFNDHHRFPMYSEQMLDYFNEIIRSKNNLVLAIIDKLTKKHVGNISLQNIDTVNRSAEFAVIIGDKEFWGRGIGEEAGKLIIEQGFNQLNLHRIYCGTSEDNVAMQKLAVKLGFLEEGRQKEGLFKNGKYKDIIIFGLVRK